jgi:hypothetical protein
VDGQLTDTNQVLAKLWIMTGKQLHFNESLSITLRVKNRTVIVYMERVYLTYYDLRKIEKESAHSLPLRFFARCNGSLAASYYIFVNSISFNMYMDPEDSLF